MEISITSQTLTKAVAKTVETDKLELQRIVDNQGQKEIVAFIKGFGRKVLFSGTEGDNPYPAKGSLDAAFTEAAVEARIKEVLGAS